MGCNDGFATLFSAHLWRNGGSKVGTFLLFSPFCTSLGAPVYVFAGGYYSPNPPLFDIRGAPETGTGSQGPSGVFAALPPLSTSSDDTAETFLPPFLFAPPRAHQVY